MANAELILSWNGRTKIMLAMRPECARWNASYFKDLINALLSHARTEWSSDNIVFLLQICVKGGSPKFLLGLLYAGVDHFREYSKVADVADSELKDGCSALSKLFFPWFYAHAFSALEKARRGFLDYNRLEPRRGLVGQYSIRLGS